MIKKVSFFLLFIVLSLRLGATQLLVPMDNGQSNHLKAYGIAYWCLDNGVVIEWLLNYKGGAFLMPHLQEIERELTDIVLTDGEKDLIRLILEHPKLEGNISSHGINLIDGFY